jgi:hypothetical protein
VASLALVGDVSGLLETKILKSPSLRSAAFTYFVGEIFRSAEENDEIKRRAMTNASKLKDTKKARNMRFDMIWKSQFSCPVFLD